MKKLLGLLAVVVWVGAISTFGVAGDPEDCPTQGAQCTCEEGFVCRFREWEDEPCGDSQACECTFGPWNNGCEGGQVFNERILVFPLASNCGGNGCYECEASLSVVKCFVTSCMPTNPSACVPLLNDCIPKPGGQFIYAVYPRAQLPEQECLMDQK